ncbi:MAG: hypothetical protein II139_00100 [Lachnospiraceae bacterium]|nr:hypothetical protein [Lachnospiraceae bacterium]
MKLRSLRCPNCNGNVRQANGNRYVCESCGTSFMMDYDKDDVAYQKAKAEAEREKARADMMRARAEFTKDFQKEFNYVTTSQRKISTASAKVMALVIVMAIAIIAITFSIVFAGFGSSVSRRTQRQQEYEKARAEQQSRAKELEEDIAAIKERQQEAAEKISEARESIEQSVHSSDLNWNPDAISTSEWDKYVAQESLHDYLDDVDFLLGQEEYCEEAQENLLRVIKYNTDYYLNESLTAGEPVYVTSYLLVAKDSSRRTQNMIVGIYKVPYVWKKDDGTTEKFNAYDAAYINNVLVWNNERLLGTYADQFTLHKTDFAGDKIFGYLDLDELIEKEVTKRENYNITEFSFKK